MKYFLFSYIQFCFAENFLPNGYSYRTVTRSEDTRCISAFCVLKAQGGSYIQVRVIIQARAAQNVDDNLCNNVVFNDTVWLAAIRQVEWLKKCKSCTISAAEKLSISEQDPGLTSVLMKGLGCL